MNANEQFRILKVGTCPSLSLASQLNYHLVQKDDQVYLGIAGNTGGGPIPRNTCPSMPSSPPSRATNPSPARP